MFTSSRKRRHSPLEIWPGFVDALSTILMVIIFVLMTFVVAQLFLTDALSGRDQALSHLNQRIKSITQSLGESQMKNEAFALRNSELEEVLVQLKQSINALNLELQNEQNEKNTALQANQNLNQQMAELHEHLKRLNEALGASENQVKNQEATINDLSTKLNRALLEKVEELKRLNEQLDSMRTENENAKATNRMEAYRSEFFSRLKQAIGNRQDIRIVGDRFVFQSELFFAQASAELSSEGQAQLNRLAQTLKEITLKIPGGINWVLRVDGHTDLMPIRNPQFPSNWELSSARAIAVVKFLMSKGIEPQHLVAAGFGEHQPLSKGATPEDLARNRRIEFKLDQR